MTSLLMHTIEHSTRLFLAHKQKPAHEKVFKSCSQLSKSRHKLDVILENEVVQKVKFQKIFQ